MAKNMGWSNYIIIPDMKLAIQTTRYVEELEDYIKKALEDAIDEEPDELAEMDNVKITDVTLRDLKALYTAHERMRSIAEFEYDKLLLFWLENRDIRYEIKSEYQVDIDEYKNDGYNIIEIN